MPGSVSAAPPRRPRPACRRSTAQPAPAPPRACRAGFSICWPNTHGGPGRCWASRCCSSCSPVALSSVGPRAGGRPRHRRRCLSSLPGAARLGGGGRPDADPGRNRPDPVRGQRHAGAIRASRCNSPAAPPARRRAWATAPPPPASRLRCATPMRSHRRPDRLGAAVPPPRWTLPGTDHRRDRRDPAIAHHSGSGHLLHRHSRLGSAS